MNKILPALVLLFCACTDNPVAYTDVATPKLVTRSNDTAVFERGIRAWPEAAYNTNGGIRIEWYSLEDVGGFSVYRTDMTDSASGLPVGFERIAKFRIGETDEDTAYVDTLIERNRRYFYSVRAFDRSVRELEGSSSDTADFLMEDPIRLINPGQSVEFGQPVNFRWTGSPGYSVIRVYEVVNKVSETIGRPVWVYGANIASFSDPNFVYDADNRALPLIKGNKYRWRITRVSPGKSRGAASPWRSFTVE